MVQRSGMASKCRHGLLTTSTTVLLLVSSVGATSYEPGDVVPMMRRTQYKGQRTEWHDVPSRSRPHFLCDRSSSLEFETAALQHDHAEGEPYKLALALDGLNHVTPWVTIADGKGRFLAHLELTLTALGDEISSMRWATQYVDEEPPSYIVVRTVWMHDKEIDEGLAFTVMFGFSAIITIGLFAWSCWMHGRPVYEKLMMELQEADEHAGDDAGWQQHRSAPNCPPSIHNSHSGPGRQQRRSLQDWKGMGKGD